MSGPQLRRRVNLQGDYDHNSGTSKDEALGTSTVLKKMDVFTKIDDDFKVSVTISSIYHAIEEHWV